MPERQPMNIWTVDGAAIRQSIKARNAIRKSAMLPLLDEQNEFEHACLVIRGKRRNAFKASKPADYERFHDAVYAERGAPSSFMGRWAWHTDINKRFEAFLHASYADEIATMLEIAPDYLAITRETVESKSIEGPAYGVLEVDSPVERTYDTTEINFLTGFANVLAEAVATQMLLAENRLLTRELHHRVRNNLQLIQGLLDRCAARVSDEQAKVEIESIALRVMTLAQVQDQLLGTGMSRTIDFGDYLKSLCAILPNLQTVQTGNVHLACDAESVILDLDTVTSLGMVVAELVTNSYSHAFPDGREGSISVSLSRSRPHQTATLNIKDNGIGFDSAPESKRYGLGLVKQLAEKVHGTIDVRSGEGTTWTLTVPTLSY